MFTLKNTKQNRYIHLLATGIDKIIVLFNSDVDGINTIQRSPDK